MFHVVFFALVFYFTRVDFSVGLAPLAFQGHLRPVARVLDGTALHPGLFSYAELKSNPDMFTRWFSFGSPCLQTDQLYGNNQ